MSEYPMMSSVVFFVFIAIIIGGVVTWDNLKSKIWELQEENKDLKSRIDYLEKIAGDSLIASRFRRQMIEKKLMRPSRLGLRRIMKE